ncbi:MAG: hypothetical protein GEU80_07070 [Dehalococcoidia bacterium]|nr:hypothetical protein [Dehalococcoidia bacterium]
MAQCTHLDQVQDVTPSSPDGCTACLAAGDRWVTLRLCMTCGNVGCCDSSPNRHATGHHRETEHPIVRSFELGQSWWWCYPEEMRFEREGYGPVRT